MTCIWCFDNIPMPTECTPKWSTAVSTIFDYCKNITQNAPKCAIFRSEVKKFFLGRGTAPSSDPSPVGRGIPPPYPPRSAPAAPRSSRLRRSAYTPDHKSWICPCRRWEICRTNQNTAATALYSNICRPYISKGSKELATKITKIAFLVHPTVVWSPLAMDP